MLLTSQDFQQNMDPPKSEYQKTSGVSIWRKNVDYLEFYHCVFALLAVSCYVGGRESFLVYKFCVANAHLVSMAAHAHRDKVRLSSQYFIENT